MSRRVGFEPAIRAHKKRRAEGGFDLVQRLARAGLRERKLLRGAEERTVLAERDQEVGQVGNWAVLEPARTASRTLIESLSVLTA